MAFEAANLRLFGLDLGRVLGAFRQGWEGALRWPAFAWLSPAQPIAVVWPDGTRRICMGVSLKPADASVRPRFHALVLPSDIVLAHVVKLPHLLESEISQALEIELQSISPFPTDQLVWGWRIDDVSESGLTITLAFTPRSHAQRHLDQLARFPSAPLEVWAEADGAVVLDGFGESRRKARMRSQRRRIQFMLVLAIVLAGLLAVSHFWQVRARVFDAQEQFASLQTEASPYVEVRNALTQASEKAIAIRGFLDGHVNAAMLLETLTELLPDGAWLSRLDVDGRRVRISGQAADAAALMEQLRARTEFSELRALSPITRGRDGRDSFNLEFTVAVSAEAG